MRVGQVGAVSRDLKGEELAEMRELADAGVIAFSDDGKPMADADLLLHALRYARGTGRPCCCIWRTRACRWTGSCTKASGAPVWGCEASPRWGIGPAGPRPGDHPLRRC